MCIFERFKGFFSCLMKGLPILVTAASLATAVIPNPSPEAAIAIKIIHKLADIAALNVANNAKSSQGGQ